jgi:hypothetical protein
MPQKNELTDKQKEVSRRFREWCKQTRLSAVALSIITEIPCNKIVGMSLARQTVNAETLREISWRCAYFAREQKRHALALRHIAKDADAAGYCTVGFSRTKHGKKLSPYEMLAQEVMKREPFVQRPRGRPRKGHNDKLTP